MEQEEVDDVPKDEVGRTVEDMVFDNPPADMVVIVRKPNGKYKVMGFHS